MLSEIKAIRQKIRILYTKNLSSHEDNDRQELSCCQSSCDIVVEFRGNNGIEQLQLCRIWGQ